MTTHDKMMRKLPSYYSRAGLADRLQKCASDEIDRIEARLGHHLSEVFAASTTDCIARYERIYGIPPGDTLTLEARREAVLAKMLYRLSATPKNLKALAESVIGCTVELVENNPAYTLTVEYPLGKGNGRDLEMQSALRRLMPAHISLTVGSATDGTIRYGFLVSVCEKITIKA